MRHGPLFLVLSGMLLLAGAATALSPELSAKDVPKDVPAKEAKQVPAPKVPAPRAEDTGRLRLYEKPMPPERYESPMWGYLVMVGFVLVLALIMQKGGGESGFMDRVMQRDFAARGMGLFLILFGLFLAFMLAYEPFAQARAHEERISFRSGFVAFPVLLVLTGLILATAGKHSKKFLITQFGQQTSALQKIVFVVQLTLSLGLEFGLRNLFERWGYTYGW